MNDLPSLYNWANNLDSLITANSVKIMKISFSGEICQGELEKVEKPSDLFFALEKTEVMKGKTHDYVLGRFVHTLRLTCIWGHEAAHSLKNYAISVPLLFDET